MSSTLGKKFKSGGNDPLQYELINHEKHVTDLIVSRIYDKKRIESERIKGRDKVSFFTLASQYITVTKLIGKPRDNRRTVQRRVAKSRKTI